MNIESIDNINIYWKQIFHSLKRASQPILLKLDLTKVDANILLALSRKKETTKADLAQYLSFKPNSLTRSLDRLIDISLIKREIDVNDQRFIRITLTKRGKHIANQYIKEMHKVWLRMLHGINKHDIELLEALLKKIQSNIYEN